MARAGYDVSFVIPEDRPTRREERNIEIIGVKRRSGRLGRMLTAATAVAVAGLRRGGRYTIFTIPT